MTQFKDRRLLTTLLKESILQLCKISVGLVGDYEIDGLICISSSESDDQHIVVKVHEQIVNDGCVKRTSGSPELHSDGKQGMSPEPRTNARDEIDWRSGANSNHKRWTDNGSHERKRLGRHADPCRAEVRRGDSESPDQHGHDAASSSNAHATRLRNSFYVDTRTASSPSFPPDLGIGHCSYSIAGDRRRSRPQTELSGLRRKRVSSCDVVVGENKRIRCSSDDARGASESSLAQAYDDGEDVKHDIRTVGLSEVYDYCEAVNVKKEVDSLAGLCLSAGKSGTEHSVIVATRSSADYEVMGSSQEVDSASIAVSNNGLIERDIHMTSSASRDAGGGSPGDVVLPSIGGIGESATYLCSLCNDRFRSELDMAAHFSECHTCTETFCCDRCHRGFSDEQAYTIHTCSDEHAILSDNANSGKCKQVVMSDGAEGCHYSDADGADYNNHDHVQQTFDDAFVSDADNNTDSLPTVLSELSFATTMQTNELHSAKPHRNDLYPVTDKSFVDTLIGENDYSRVNHDDADTNSDYRCIVCQILCESYAALEAHSLQEHKRYTCPHCNKSFTQTSSRNRHMHTHGCRKPFACLHCSARFTRADTLRRHYTREHHSTALPAWLRMNMPVRNDATAASDRTQSLDAVTLQSAWPSSSPAVDVNNGAVVAHTYLTTVLRENVRSKAEMIEISDDGE